MGARKVEAAERAKTRSAHELAELQTKYEEVRSSYHSAVQEKELHKVGAGQHEMLVKQVDELHAQLKQSRDEHSVLRDKAQLHYTRRKEEWKKLKQLEADIHAKDERLTRYAQREESEGTLCGEITELLGAIKALLQMDEAMADQSSLTTSRSLDSFLQHSLISLTAIQSAAQRVMHDRRQMAELTEQNEQFRFDALKVQGEVQELTSTVSRLKLHRDEAEQAAEAVRLKWREEMKKCRVEVSEVSEKVKLMEQQNENLRTQTVQLSHDVQELEEENGTLRQERRRSLEGNSNADFVAEKVNLQRQIRVLREERDTAEKQLKENGSADKELKLKMHQIELQFESAQQKISALDSEKESLKAEGAATAEQISTLEAEKMALSQKNNELYDGNVGLEQQIRGGQQEVGRLQSRATRLREQRDYAKSKYKELKAKFTKLEQQFATLQSRYSSQGNTGHTTMPF